MTQEIRVTFALLIASELVREDRLPVPLPEVGTAEGIDGALILSIGGHEFINERYWDRLDALFLNLLDALEQITRGEKAEALFPDTRVALQFIPQNDKLTLMIEQTRSEVSLGAFGREIQACIQRFIALSPALVQTANLETLRSRAEALELDKI